MTEVHFAQDDPMQEWKPWMEAFLEETMRGHALGHDTYEPQCSSCGIALASGTVWLPSDAQLGPPSESTTSDNLPSNAVCSELFRCRNCGDFLECTSCCVARHKRFPLHVIEVS